MIDNHLRIIRTHIAKHNIHDFKLFKESRLPILKETLVCVDSGYTGLDKLHQNSQIPKKRSQLQPLSQQEKIENRLKASKRISIEHINAKIKTFNILALKYRNRRKRFGLRFNLICALVNWDRGFALTSNTMEKSNIKRMPNLIKATA